MKGTIKTSTFVSEVNKPKLLFQDPRLLCVAYSAVGKLSRCAARIIVLSLW